jgi:hypothetical protein
VALGKVQEAVLGPGSYAMPREASASGEELKCPHGTCLDARQGQHGEDELNG